MPESLGCASSPGENLPLPAHFVSSVRRSRTFLYFIKTSYGRPAKKKILVAGEPKVFQTP